MSDHNNYSQSEEMYLVTIRQICEHCADAPIPISEVAAALGVQPVSVNQMIKKLAEAGLVNYIPYKGAELTPAGRTISTRILRHRRLWEVFLVKNLKMDLDTADELACQLEHLTATDVAERLSEFLGHPQVCFHGDPIPQPDEEPQSLFAGIPLPNLEVGQTGPVMRIEADEQTIGFLAGEGIRPGVQICPLAIGSRGQVLLESQNRRVNLSEELAACIFVGQPGSSEYQKETPMSIPLSNLKVGDRGTILKMNFKGATRQRLLAMGVVRGETILVKRVAPLGDPIDFVIKGYDLSLRKSEASEIMVTPLPEGE